MARKKKEAILETVVRDITDFPGPVEVDVVLGKGMGTKGKWTFGWSFLVGGTVLKYEDGQTISARTNELFEAMTSFRRNRKTKEG